MSRDVEGLPETGAGQTLLDKVAPSPKGDAQELPRRSASGRRFTFADDILAIEAEARLEGLAEAKRRLSVVGMHDGKCPEPDKPCSCGLDAAIDNPAPVSWMGPDEEDPS